MAFAESHELQMREATLQSVKSKIYNKASRHYLKERGGQKTPIIEQDIRELQILVEEYLQYPLATRANLKSDLLEWAGNYPEIQVRDHLNQYIQNIFTWGV